MPRTTRDWNDPISLALAGLTGLFSLAVVLALIVGAINLANSDEPGMCPGNFNELAVSVNVWLLVYGIVGAVMVVVVAIEWCMSPDSNERWTASWFWGLLALFLVFPWLIVGQVLLLGGATCTAGSGTFGVAVYGLVVLYLLVAAAAACTSWAIYDLQA